LFLLSAAMLLYISTLSGYPIIPVFIHNLLNY
jgi:hypothetical protein